MAVHTYAVALGSPFLCILMCLLCVWCSYTHTNWIYSRQDLLDIGFQYKVPISSDFHHEHNIPMEAARPPGSPWIVFGHGKRRRRRREHKQKRGCRAGLLAKLRKNPHKPPLPSLLLTNARSVVTKTDNLELLLTATSTTAVFWSSQKAGFTR